MTAGDMATPKQMAKIVIEFAEHGVKDREVRLAIISHWVGQPIVSMKDLMRTEASYIIDFIVRDETGELAATIERFSTTAVPS